VICDLVVSNGALVIAKNIFKLTECVITMGRQLSLSDEDAQPRIDMIRRLVAQPFPEQPWADPEPAFIEGGCVLIGNKYHAADVANLNRLGVTAVLNCASLGISRLPVDKLKESGIQYAFTNVRQDNHTYPILHDAKSGDCSKHLEIAKSLYGQVKQAGGKVLFFCIAGTCERLNTIFHECTIVHLLTKRLLGYRSKPISYSRHRSHDVVRAFSGQHIGELLENTEFYSRKCRLSATTR
jgi:hypothetical protein